MLYFIIFFICIVSWNMMNMTDCIQEGDDDDCSVALPHLYTALWL